MPYVVHTLSLRKNGRVDGEGVPAGGRAVAQHGVRPGLGEDQLRT